MTPADYQLAHSVVYLVGLVVVLGLAVALAVAYRVGAPGLKAFGAVLFRLASLVAAIVAVLSFLHAQQPSPAQRDPPPTTAVAQVLDDGVTP